MGSTDPNGEGPKLEDFLGCCYSNDSPSDDTKVYCQTQQDRINVNLPPSFNNNGEENLTDPCPLVQPYHYEENPRNIVHPTLLQHCDPNSNHNNGVYHVPFDSATSVSGFKSWLRRAPFCSEKSSCEAANNYDFESLSLTMSPNSKAGMSTALSPLQAVENRKCSAGKSHAREPVPRKSIDTFGQRTSQWWRAGGLEASCGSFYTGKS